MRLLKRLAQVLGILLGIALVAGCATGLWFWTELRGSLPKAAGKVEIAGLGSEVRIERDALGVPRILAKSEADAACALGWLHGQERFFQMDLMRRRAAGELSAIVGPATIELDKDARVHTFRARAAKVLESTQGDDRAILAAYTAGVNAGLAALRSKPIEYVMLRVEPEPWRPEDTFLVLFNMFLELQEGDGATETLRGTLHDTLPAPLADFLDARGSEWDAPVVGAPFEVAPIPGPEILDLRSATPVSPASGRTPPPRDFGQLIARSFERDEEADGPILGSNNWAVSGAHTADGHAWLANDMHLGLQLPNIWYRAQMRWSDAWSDAEGSVDATGVTLPGAPVIVAGSNGHVAWGFTNSQIDTSDVVVVDTIVGSSQTWKAEMIAVKGGDPVAFDVHHTPWGPVVGKDSRGRMRALHWTAYERWGVNVNLRSMMRARTVPEAFQVAAASGIPAQNMVVVDADGRIGWTICGRIPLREDGVRGGTPTLVSSLRHPPQLWMGHMGQAWNDGFSDPPPTILDPPMGRIWTANNRVVDGPMLQVLGDGGYALGARARQIRDDLMALERATPQDMLKVQLDDRAVFFERWQKLIATLLNPEVVSAKPLRAEARPLIEDWGGRASVDSVGFRIVRSFRSTVQRDVWSALTAPCRRADPTFRRTLWQFEGPLWRLVSETPAHLVPPPHATWNAFLLDAFDRTLADMTKDGTPLAQATWGKRNTVRVGHPLAQGVPSLARWLDMPALELPGAEHMPRVQSPGEGASERLVVSPGQEDKSFFHMPGGQSGHPSSPHYGDGHQAWAKGEPTPFLPGPAVDVLLLEPKRR